MSIQLWHHECSLKLDLLPDLLATEQDGADLLKRVLEKVGSYTDVLVAVGGFTFRTTILEMPLDELRKV